jgi:hypothetical protein
VVTDFLEPSQPRNVNRKATNQWLRQQISTRDQVLMESWSGLDRISIESAKTSHFAGIFGNLPIVGRGTDRGRRTLPGGPPPRGPIAVAGFQHGDLLFRARGGC